MVGNLHRKRSLWVPTLWYVNVTKSKNNLINNNSNNNVQIIELEWELCPIWLNWDSKITLTINKTHQRQAAAAASWTLKLFIHEMENVFKKALRG